MKMSDQRLMSGRAQTIGNGAEVPYPIDLDPSQYKGTIVYASDKNCYYSDGIEWRIPATSLPIARPRALVPLNSEQQSQLRLSKFFSSTGEFQAGVQFEVSLTNDFENDILFTRSFTDDSTNMYQTLYPDDGLSPNQQFYWRAIYTGSDGSQSEYSEPYLQTYPGLIDTPDIVTKSTDRTGTVVVTPYFSPEIFGIGYYETQTEFYTEDGNFILSAVTQYGGASTTIPDVPELPEGATYRFRSRYGGRTIGSINTIYSDWSDKGLFFNGAGSMMLQFDISLAPSRTITLGLNGVVNATVFWGDGTSNTYTSATNASKIYSIEAGNITNIIIKGTLTTFRVAQNCAMALRRVDSWGLKLGLTSLEWCLQSTTNTLQYVSPDLPSTVTTLGWMFHNSATNCDLNNLNVSNVTNMGWMFNGATAFNQPLNNWDVSNVTNMRGMFSQANTFNQDISNWDTSKVTDMGYMFHYKPYNQPLNNWDVSNVTNMVQMFYANGTFNQPLNNWDVSNVTSMGSMFGSGVVFNQDISNWNTSNVTDMGGMFSNAQAFNQPIGNWDVSNVTNMSNMFQSSPFNQPIGNWNVSNVTIMKDMFSNAQAFNQPIGNWDVSNVIDMRSMFSNAQAFNQPIGNWDVSNVTSMSDMFSNAQAFNQPIGNWDVSKVTSMVQMFLGNRGFNQDISNWNVSKVTNMQGMFRVTNFNQPLNNWDVSNVTDMSFMFDNAYTFNQPIGNWNLRRAGVNLTRYGIPSYTKIPYSMLLVGWANNIHRNGGPFGITFPVDPGRQYDNLDYSLSFPGGRFANAVQARAFLISSRGFIVANATNASANGQYAFNSTNSTYTNSTSGWYFIKIINDWQLRDDTNVVRDVSGGNQTEPYLGPLYTSILAPATYDPTGAQWTITGDQLA